MFLLPRRLNLRIESQFLYGLNEFDIIQLSISSRTHIHSVEDTSFLAGRKSLSEVAPTPHGFALNNGTKSNS